MTDVVSIVNTTSLPDDAFAETAKIIETVFHCPVEIHYSTMDFEKAYDGSRDQYNSTAFIAQLLEWEGNKQNKSIMVTEVDLYIPVLTFVFGEAQLGGRAAVVSTHRLSNHFYGLSRDDVLMSLRLQKEIIHELGHTFGLYHCHQFECVMRSSTYVGDIDLKNAYPCSQCTEKLGTRSSTSNVSLFRR